MDALDSITRKVSAASSLLPSEGSGNDLGPLPKAEVQPTPPSGGN